MILKGKLFQAVGFPCKFVRLLLRKTKGRGWGKKSCVLHSVFCGGPPESEVPCEILIGLQD